MAIPQLENIAAKVAAGDEPQETVRTLLSWFGAQRRLPSVVQHIRRELRRLNLVTIPDFLVVYIDAEIVFRGGESLSKQTKTGEEEDRTGVSEQEIIVVDDEGEIVYSAIEDASYRIGKLPSANKTPISVTPNDSLEKAITLMLGRDFSQLPVLTGERDLKGIVSWKSIGKHLTVVGDATEVRSVMEEACEVRNDVSIFEALPLIARYEYVLVRNSEDRRIVGIVTNSDLAAQFRQLAEPFLLLGEIENYLRQLLDGKFTKKELEDARDPSDSSREVLSVSDLTFGEYIRVLENESHWLKLSLKLDRKTFVAELHRIREIRNDVMHFDPDPMGPDDLSRLRDFTEFLRELKKAELF